MSRYGGSNPSNQSSPPLDAYSKQSFSFKYGI